MTAATETRMKRLRAREIERYGREPGGRMHESQIAFLDWAAGYDDGGVETRAALFTKRGSNR